MNDGQDDNRSTVKNSFRRGCSHQPILARGEVSGDDMQGKASTDNNWTYPVFRFELFANAYDVTERWQKKLIHARVKFMTVELSTPIWPDGSRMFKMLRKSKPWPELREHLLALEGVSILDFDWDDPGRSWLTFTFMGYQFRVKVELTFYFFAVTDANCEEDVLKIVAGHCQDFLK